MRVVASARACLLRGYATPSKKQGEVQRSGSVSLRKAVSGGTARAGSPKGGGFGTPTRYIRASPVRAAVFRCVGRAPCFVGASCANTFLVGPSRRDRRGRARNTPSPGRLRGAWAARYPAGPAS